MVKKLQAEQVAVQSLFFDDTSEEVTHEYQFQFDTKAAQESYKHTKNFIQTYK